MVVKEMELAVRIGSNARGVADVEKGFCGVNIEGNIKSLLTNFIIVHFEDGWRQYVVEIGTDGKIEAELIGKHIN